MYGSLAYGFSLFSNADLPRTTREFRFAHVWLVLSPTAGIVLWLWALYDWGTRRLETGRKLMWLFILILTLYFGATVYFLIVGLKSGDKV